MSADVRAGRSPPLHVAYSLAAYAEDTARAPVPAAACRLLPVCIIYMGRGDRQGRARRSKRARPRRPRSGGRRGSSARPTPASGRPRHALGAIYLPAPAPLEPFAIAPASRRLRAPARRRRGARAAGRSCRRAASPSATARPTSSSATSSTGRRFSRRARAAAAAGARAARCGSLSGGGAGQVVLCFAPPGTDPATVPAALQAEIYALWNRSAAAAAGEEWAQD